MNKLIDVMVGILPADTAYKRSLLMVTACIALIISIVRLTNDGAREEDNGVSNNWRNDD